MQRRIRLAVEAPATMLGYLREQTDLDFPIAYRVLEDPEYANYYRNRDNRECILDNGFHELREALPISELLRAAELVRPDYIVAPDRMDDPGWSAASFLLLQQELILRGHQWKIAVNLCGNTAEERETYLRAVHHASMLCLPYDRPRMLWYLEQLPHWRRIHLLGVSELPELLAWKVFLPFLDLSVDTGKPVKYGILGQDISGLIWLRRSGLASKRLLELRESITHEQLRMAIQNTEYLRSLLG